MRLFKGFLIALISVSMFIVIGIAFAQQTSNEQLAEKKPFILSSEDEAEFRAGFSEDGIDEVTQDKLIAKLKNGEAIDSMDPIKRSEAAKNLVSTMDNPRVEYVFDDGSKIISEVKLVGVNVTDEHFFMPPALMTPENIEIVKTGMADAGIDDEAVRDELIMKLKNGEIKDGDMAAYIKEFKENAAR